MTFEVWLKQFKKKDNPFGDLARDFEDTGCHTVQQSFDKYMPCDAAWNTYKKARHAYILELANLLHNELGIMLCDEAGKPQLWHESFNTLHDLKDTLADIESYLNSELEDDE